MGTIVLKQEVTLNFEMKISNRKDILVNNSFLYIHWYLFVTKNGTKYLAFQERDYDTKIL